MDGDKLIQAEKKLSQYEGSDKVISFEEMSKITKENYKKYVSFKSGIPTLDRILGGFDAGQLVVISGITGEGKTTLARTLTTNFSNQGIKSLWFSYEEDEAYYFLQNFPELPVAYMPKKLTKSTVNWLENRIWEARLKYDIKVVFVDHLHYLVDLARMRNSSLEIGQIVRNLKLLAKRHNIIFFLICHTKFITFKEEPGLGSTRDSSFIEQEADSVLYIWRAKEDNQSKLKIAKNRKRGIKNKIVNLMFSNNQLSELEKKRQEEDSPF